MLPALAYGALVWGARLRKYEARFRRLNRMAINIAVRIPKSKPTRAVEIILNIPPVEKVIEGAVTSSYLRLRTGDENE